MPTKVFFVEPTNVRQIFLRRYHSNSIDAKCDVCEGGYHQARQWIRDEVSELDEGYERLAPDVSDDEPRWPKQAACGYVFTDEDPRQVFTERVYRRTDTETTCTIRDRVPGMMYDAHWMGDHFKGADGRSLIVICPNGVEWAIDGPASNCTDPENMEHRCWCRHGEPPNITVDKNGNTCQAGGGSIQAGNYHGFLRNGEFTDA